MAGFATATGSKYGVKVVTSSATISFLTISYDHNSTTRSACTCGESTCGQCTGRMPTWYQVEIAGYADGSCTDCTDLNGTYLVSSNSQTLPAGSLLSDCNRRYVLPTSICSSTYIQLVHAGGFSYVLRLTDSAASFLDWQHSYGGSQPDCENGSRSLSNNVSLPGTTCTMTGATVDVDALNV
jgi:hypothetical protein